MPTPNAEDSTPTDEFVEEMLEAGVRPDERLYLEGRKWHSQRTLSRIAPALLPTPSANDSTGAEKETRDARRERGTGGPSLRDLPRLLPTPAATDGKGADLETREGGASLRGLGRLLSTPHANLGEHRRDNGQDPAARRARGKQVSLADVVRYETETKLLPTPMANEENPGAGGELRAAITHGPGRRNETGVDSWGRPNRGRTPEEPLLPTPRPGANRNSRRAMVEEKQWSAPALEQAVEIASGILPREFETWEEVPGRSRLLPTPTAEDGERGRGRGQAGGKDAPGPLLPTPQASDATGGRQEKTAMRNQGKRPSGQKATLTLGTAVELSGELTSTPFAAGSSSSEGPHPGQLTIEDA